MIRKYMGRSKYCRVQAGQPASVGKPFGPPTGTEPLIRAGRWRTRSGIVMLNRQGPRLHRGANAK